MFDLFGPGRSLAWDLAWQSSAFLAAGIAASALAFRRPARAHRVLFLAMAAGLATPLLGQGVRHLGLGLFAPKAVETAPPVLIAEVSSPMSISPEIATRPESPPGRFAEAPVASIPAKEVKASKAGFSLRGSLIWIWAALTVAASARLLASIVLGMRVVSGARRVDDPAILAAADAARDRLGLLARPVVFATSRVRCPVIWCWGSRPRLIIPESAARGGSGVVVDWVAVLSHELAHWGRRDHLAGLVGEVVACVLPWHPLAWWAKGRMGQLAELACDDWVLASGQPAVDYAETLLGLVPQGRRSLALAAVTTRGGLVGRIRRILDDAIREPNPGRRWAAIATIATTVAASAVAMAQVRPLVAKAVLGVESNEEAAAERVVTGRIFLPDGKPAAGAMVDWVGAGSTKLSGHALPRQMSKRPFFRHLELGRAVADAEGKFRMAASFNPDDVTYTTLVARAPGMALIGRTLMQQAAAEDVTLKLAPSVRIEGRLLTPSGSPAAGVTVNLIRFHNGGFEMASYEGVNFDPDVPESERPDYRPKEMTTDKDGRFILDGVVPKGTMAEFTFRHPDFADDAVTVSTGLALTDMLRAFSIRPVRPQFTHTLEPGRPVVGTITDKASGKPLPGVAVEMIPMRKHGGQSFYTTTDAEGRYRVAGHAADMYFVNAYAPAGSGYIDTSQNRQGWPEGAKVLTVDFALERGKVFRGTVVDGETRKPLSGVSVVYQPTRGNPNNPSGSDFRNPVLTDAEGRFAINGLPGEGQLLVEAAVDYARGKLSGREAGVLGNTLYPHGVAKVDVPADLDPKPVEIALRKGKTLEAQAVGPDGKPLDMVMAWCPELTYRQLMNWTSPNAFAKGLFKLPGAEPGRTYRVFFLDMAKKHGAVASLTFDPAGPRPVVKLQPMATAKGVAVNKDGTPAKGVQISPIVVLTEDPAPIKENEIYDRDKADFYANMTGNHFTGPTTPAEFAFKDLIPGVRYYIAVSRNGGTYREVRALAPGEVLDLGKITVEDKR